MVHEAVDGRRSGHWVFEDLIPALLHGTELATLAFDALAGFISLIFSHRTSPLLFTEGGPVSTRGYITADTAAWAKADEATQRLGVLVGEHKSTKAIVKAVGSRLGVDPNIPKFDPDAKVRERVKRG